MEFREAFKAMRAGKKVRLPSWSGYWAWENGTIMMHCHDGRVLDIRNTDDPAYTFTNIASSAWKIVGEMTDLKDTVAAMVSADYKERFKAEYYQTVIRFKKLMVMLKKWDAGKLDFTPTCCRGIYNLQIRAMADYIAALEARAQIEGIKLEG